MFGRLALIIIYCALISYGYSQTGIIQQYLEQTPPNLTISGIEEGADTYVAKEGFAQVEWKFPEDLQTTIDETPEEQKPVFELQQAQDAAFTEPVTIYEGRDLASVVSGLAEGEYYFRVRGRTADGSVVSDWSEARIMSVEYPAYDLFLGGKLLWWLLGAGLLVFILTVGFLVIMSRRVIDLDEAVNGAGPGAANDQKA